MTFYTNCFLCLCAEGFQGSESKSRCWTACVYTRWQPLAGDTKASECGWAQWRATRVRRGWWAVCWQSGRELKSEFVTLNLISVADWLILTYNCSCWIFPQLFDHFMDACTYYQLPLPSPQLMGTTPLGVKHTPLRPVRCLLQRLSAWF